MIKNIVLIEPKSRNIHVYSTVNMPRLGLPILGSILKKHGYNVEIIFSRSSDLNKADIESADLIGISLTTSTSLEGYKIARFAKDMGKPIIMGGSHATFMPEEVLHNCDYVIRGEAESSIIPLVKCIEEGSEPVNIPGVSYLKGDKIINNELAPFEDINSLPVPDMSLFKNPGRIGSIPVMTSRGCPYNCTFCSVTLMFGRRYRFRNTELVLKEIEKYKGKNIFFCDDNFTANPSHTKELLTKMLERNIIPKRWSTQVRADVVRDEELLDLMKRTNCLMVFVGLESINPRTLEQFNKQQTVGDIEKCISKFHEKGIMVHGMFVFGGDDDTVTTIKETVDFALKAKIDTVQWLILTPLPGTPLFEQLEREGRILTEDWSYYDGHHVVFQPKRMSPAELQNETIKAYKKFYSPRNIFNNVGITSLLSVGLKGLGWGLARHWEKNNWWYDRILDGFVSRASMVTRHKTNLLQKVKTFNVKGMGTVAATEYLKMKIYEQNGVFHINLQGLVNSLTLKKFCHVLKKNVPQWQRDLIINARNIKFASEDIARCFCEQINKLGAGKGRVKIVAKADHNLFNILKKYSTKIPHFEITTSEPVGQN